MAADPRLDIIKAAPMEKKIAGMLLAKFPNSTVEIMNDRLFRDYDILLRKSDGQTRTYEVKEDSGKNLGNWTGNVAVEYGDPYDWERSKLLTDKDSISIPDPEHRSGITVSKADWYVYAVHKAPDDHVDLHFISLKELLRACFETQTWKNGGRAIITERDPNHKKKCFLFPLAEFTKITKNIVPVRTK